MLFPIFSAILLSFCFPFASAWWLAWLALTPWYYALMLAKGNARAGFVSGFWFGLTLHLVGMFWMVKVGEVPWAMLSVIESGWFAVMGAIAAPLLFRLPGWARPIVFAALWTCLEYARSQGSAAFPWFLLAATQVPCLQMVQIVSATGQWGLSFAVAAVSGLLVEAWRARKYGDKVAFQRFAGVAVYVPVALMLGGWLTLVNMDAAERSDSDGNIPRRTVGIIQGNIGKVPENSDSSTLDEYRQSAIETYLQMTRYLAAHPGEQKSPPAFILWPETVVPGYLLHDFFLLNSVSCLARETKTDLLVGTMDAGENRETFNSVVHLDATGTVIRKYAKQRLVPMGEFFLFRDVLGSIYEKYNVPNNDLTPGREPGVFTVGAGDQATRVGMLICYESVFPYISRDRVRGGAQVLVQSTSDETFDNTPNPQQHADLAVLRAVETRRYFVRAGATGLSEIIDSAGRVRRKLPSQTAGTIVDTVVLHRGSTLFVRFGDWFVGLNAAISGFAILYAVVRKRLSPKSASQTPSIEEVVPPEQTTLP